MKKCKVLHIAPGFKYGGIESRLVDWYSVIDRDAIQFDVVKVTPEEPNVMVDKMRSMGGMVFSIPPLGSKSAIGHFKAMKEIMDKGNYDVIHSHSRTYGFYPLRYARKLGIKTRILHARTTGINPGQKHVAVSYLLAKMAIPYATHYFACSEEAGKWAFGDKIEATVIKNGIFLQNFAFDTEKRKEMKDHLGLQNELILGAVGRFSSPKNLPFLLDVLNLVVKRLPNVKLIFVGDDMGLPAIKAEMESKIARFSLGDHVIFAGRQERVCDWLQVFDVFLAPSLFEGFGTAALEAQANGLPCIISDRFPKSIKILDTMKVLPLDNVEVWAEAVEDCRNTYRIEDAISQIALAGYDVVSTAKWLESFYLGSANMRTP